MQVRSPSLRLQVMLLQAAASLPNIPRLTFMPAVADITSFVGTMLLVRRFAGLGMLSRAWQAVLLCPSATAAQLPEPAAACLHTET